MTERLEEIDKFKSFIDSLDDSADADDFHKFIDTCQINYEEGTFNEILRFMKSQAERVKELEEQKLALIEEMEQVDERFLESEQQNNRYKQALEYVSGELKYPRVTGDIGRKDNLIKHIIKIIDDVLEEEK